MRRSWVLALVLAACVSAGQAVPTQELLQGQFEDDSGNKMRYLVWLPDGYGDDRSRSYPLIYFLHGSGDDDYDAAFVATYGLPAVLAQGEQPSPFDFVVVAPQAEPGTTWYQGDQPAVVDALLAEMLDTYLIDEDRVYLTGLSMGGYGSWHIATRYPHRYAAMASLSGSGYQSRDLPPADFACALASVPVWGIHGQQDQIAQYAPVKAHVDGWENLCDERIKWTGYPNEGHFSTYEIAYRDSALYEWFLRHDSQGRTGS